LKAPLSLLATLWSRDEEDGQGLAEYALILGLIAVVAIVSLIFLGDTVADLMSTIGNTIDTNTLQG
jgi:Flp pilus assembly pilin Flp